MQEIFFQSETNQGNYRIFRVLANLFMFRLIRRSREGLHAGMGAGFKLLRCGYLLIFNLTKAVSCVELAIVCGRFNEAYFCIFSLK